MALDLGFLKKKGKASSASLGDEASGSNPDSFMDDDYASLTGGLSQPAPKAASGSAKSRPGSVALELRPRATANSHRSFAERFIAWQIPVIGHHSAKTQYRLLLMVMAFCALVVGAVLVYDANMSANGATQTEIVGQMLMHTQRLAKAAPYAIQGNTAAFAQLRDSRDQIDSSLEALISGNRERGLSASSADIQPRLSGFSERWATTRKAATSIIDEEAALLAFGSIVKRINDATPRLLQLTEEISALKLQSGASNREIAAAGQLVMLTQRLGKSANSMVSGDSANAETALTLGRDINLFRDLTEALLSGSNTLRIEAAKDSETRVRLQELAKVYEAFQNEISGALDSLSSIVQAKEGELTIVQAAEPLRLEVTDLQRAYGAEQDGRVLNFWLMGLFGFMVLASAVGVAKVLLDDANKRALEAETQRGEALRLEDEAKRTNERNQAAILRLMNELQEVADGNLTLQASVTEDITGAIADSVNFTVEELRGLVSRINGTAEQVNTASTAARDIATRLLTASEAQSREIKNTGEKVLKMAAQINDVSKSAGESAKVARTSLEAAERGQRAVQNQITGMNDIRDQIQETSKRIKRLGESSQEIGEIVELITDITEQTNVLALNAAIQAASAGEAGRGFSVVAEEVQRLADRSAEAAKQIGALVRTIQTDTQDAVAAMEQSTQGVVEGAKLSDATGTALADIGRVSRQLSELIERIAGTTNEQATSAGGVAKSIEHILTVTEQTSQGTRQAAQSIGQLATLARELKASVARFRVT